MFGIKVYSVVAVLFRAGDQVPIIPFVDVVGKAESTPPEHIGATAVKSGIIVEFKIVIVNCTKVVEEHCPAVGVKVYVVVVVLFKAGNQEPAIPLVDVVGKAVKTAPLHIGATALKVGVIRGLTVIVNSVKVAEVHCPGFGVKV